MAKKTSIKSKNGEKMLFKYQPVYPQAPMDMTYHYYDGDVLKIREEISTLIKSIDELKEYAKKCEGKIIGVDTETTGLTYQKDFIVGFSLCCEPGHAIYVPIRHQIRRADKVKETLTDENGNVLLTKTGKVRSKTVNKYTDFENPANLDPKQALDILYDIMLKAKLNIMHNSEFDLNMIKQEGYDVMKCPTFDTLILTYLYDAENKNWNKLKEASKIVLGRYPMKFYEALGDEENFRYVDLAVGYPYAASDALNVRDLYIKLKDDVRRLLNNAPNVISMDGVHKYDVMSRDNELIRAFTDYYNHAELIVDREEAKKYKANIEKQLAEVETTIYEYFGRGPFNLNSGSKEFKSAMADFEIDTGLKTETGATSYSKKGIEEMGRQIRAFKDILMNMKDIHYDSINGKLDKRASINDFRLANIIMSYGKRQFKMRETTNLLYLQTIEGIKMDKQMFFEELKILYKHENSKLRILQMIQTRSSLMKALNSYITKLTEVDTCRMRYRLQGTSSGRLSSGNGSKNDKSKNHYYIDLNAQNFTKPHSAMYNAIRSNAEGNILGWAFEPVTEDFVHEHKEDPEYYFVEGSDPKNNIRACIDAPEGRLIASLDYSAQEYKVLAILSQDTKMLTNFKRGLDPHTSTAYAIWGEENYDRQKRKKAKICVGNGTYLYTNNGLKKVEELSPEDKLVDFEGNYQDYVMTSDKGDLIKITWNTGITETYTPEHPLYVWNGKEFIWKEAQHIIETDDVVRFVGYHDVKVKPDVRDYTEFVKRRSQSKRYDFDINTKEFAYLTGLYLGDGSVIKYSEDKNNAGDPRLVQYCVEPGALEETLTRFQRLGVDYGTPELIGKNKTIYSVRTYNVAWANLIRDLFGWGKDKEVPDWIFTQWDKELLLEFIAGLVDSDGSSSINGIMTFDTTLPSLAKGFTLACGCCGIKTEARMKHTKYKGDDYTYTSITVYAGENKIPLLNTRKHSTMGKSSRLGNWSISEDYAKELYSHVYDGSVDRSRDKLRDTMTNIKAGRTRLTNANLPILRGFFRDFPIQENMQCVHLATSKRIENSEINVIQTVTHVYCTAGAANHNCNFLMNYGGGASTLAQSLDIPMEEAQDIIKGYEAGFFECTAWKRNCENDVISRQKGVCYSIFGRPRQFITLLSTASRLQDPKELTNLSQDYDVNELRKKGAGIEAGVKRRIISHLIQGCCGDICRWDLIQLYRKYFRNRDPHIDFMSTVHDEINFSIDIPYVVDYVRDIDDIMTITQLSSELPITTSVDLGYKLGVLFPFEWGDKERTVLVPKRA